MPQIIVTADRGEQLLRERVNISDFESDHFAAQLVERLGWAVSDAHDAERGEIDRDKEELVKEDLAPAKELAPAL